MAKEKADIKQAVRTQPQHAPASKVKHLYTEDMRLAALEIQSKAKSFALAKNRVERTTNTLMSTWQGKASREYKTQYDIIQRQLKDITDELYDIYDAIVGAQEKYNEADLETKRAFVDAMG